MTKKAVVVFAEGFEEVEAVTPVDVLRRAGVEVTTASIGGKTVTGAHGVPYVADVELSALTGDFDMIVLPGGMPGSKNIGESETAKALTEKMFKAGKLIASICAAPVFTLGAWGILDGKRATCYAGMEKMFPESVTFVPERVVVDGTVTTSRGPGTAVYFGLALAEQLMGAETAKNVAEAMLVQ